MNKKYLIPGAGILLLLIFFFVYNSTKGGEEGEILTKVNQGEFQIDIATTGELEAKNAVKINGPAGMRDYRLFQVQIESIVEEGTEVRKGDWIATLDRSELTNKIKDKELDVETNQSQFIQTQLDTALQMRQSRDQLVNLDYDVKEKQLVLDQSQYEPPATIKQAEINLEKSKRSLIQERENYKIKYQQNNEQMKEVAVNLRKARRELQDLQNLVSSFTITAPEDGMLIYKKGGDGKAIKEGSSISAWDPVVATLPDLSTMLSKTYVNEVDVRKVKSGQEVKITLDAFPDKKLTGRVISVANVGEQRANSDAKVFEVRVQINESDELLRPGMTTGNTIIAEVIPEAIYVPLECLNSKGDSITFVYKKSGLRSIGQEVQLGSANSDHVVVLAGLNSEDEVYLSVPSNSDDVEVTLIPEMDGKRSPALQKINEPTIDENADLDLPPGVTKEGDEYVIKRNGREFRMSKERFEQMKSRMEGGGEGRPSGSGRPGGGGGGQRKAPGGQ